jgi:hypothetical protein
VPVVRSNGPWQNIDDADAALAAGAAGRRPTGGDTFEAAIALAKNQVAAYAGLAAMYGLIGKRAESRDWARRGLIELEEMRRGPLGQALREGRTTVFPSDMLDQAERQLRSCLEQ